MTPPSPQKSAPASEFARIVKLDQAVSNAAGGHITAEPEECAALARRFGFARIDRLAADYTLAEENGVLMARGQLRAALAQPCVATGEPVEETIDQPFVIRFAREGELPQDGALDEFELSEEDCDTHFYAGGTIDIGEAVAQTLALAVTPYPRAPDADQWLRARGVLTEDQAGPFAALAALKGKPGG
ncbi:YceD family protein [Sphingobium algorifonticola]|uniref:DUF177 domain-containing protein n=1 Tax=Sphingobium algorifonticola TaxID=2008318 RepID=A0A437J3G4_9SPHN|nr:DUF177 domain-containing protein [Sphingobium algorifonticola]RVT38892.1 DUF177 domain-containing protein [Sphingobium algorifonticola]